MRQSQLSRIEERLARIEAENGQILASLGLLLEALVEEGEDEEPQFDLDGNPLQVVERDQDESLD